MMLEQEQQHYAQLEIMLDTPTFRPIGDLIGLGIPEVDIQRLLEAGLNTVGSFLQKSTRELLMIQGLTSNRVELIRAAARRLDCRGASFKTGNQMKEHRQHIVKISTGSNAFNRILGGGVESGSITELFGEFRTGKTQLSHTLCVTSQLAYEAGG